MGDNKRALTLIIDKLENVEMAIEFVQGIGDEDLWNDLVEQAKSKPGTSPKNKRANLKHLLKDYWNMRGEFWIR